MSIIDPRLLGNLQRFFPSRCAVQQNTPSQSASGQPLDDWATVAGMGAIPCAVSAYRPFHEVRRAEDLFAFAMRRIALAGHYPSIVPSMRAVVDEVTYDIVAVEHDSQGAATTLVARVLYPTD